MSASQEFGLVADIGGTNARFALAPLGGALTIEQPRTLPVREFPRLGDAIRTYLDKAGRKAGATVLAVAAPSGSDHVRLTNSHWRFSVDELKRELGLSSLAIINDFAANAWGIGQVDPARLRSIGPEAAPPGGPGTLVVVGPGTGLGVGGVRVDPGGQVSIIESEGGHADFAPVNDQEEKILRHLRGRFGRVSYERLVSGPGLVNIFRFVAGTDREPRPEEITAAAGTDPDAAESVKIFCQVLGSFAGNAALMYGAWNGVYLAGGMLRPVVDELLAGGFRRRFQDKGRFSTRLAEVPTWLVEEPALGLLGAAAALRSSMA